MSLCLTTSDREAKSLVNSASTSNDCKAHFACVDSSIPALSHFLIEDVPRSLLILRIADEALPSIVAEKLTFLAGKHLKLE